MTDPSLPTLIVAYVFAISGVVELGLLLYLGFYKIHDMDNLLYGSSHPAIQTFKAGGIFFANLRAGGDYGFYFWLILISKKFDKRYPDGLALSEVPTRKKIPYMVYFLAGAIFLCMGVLLSCIK